MAPLGLPIEIEAPAVEEERKPIVALPWRGRPSASPAPEGSADDDGGGGGAPSPPPRRPLEPPAVPLPPTTEPSTEGGQPPTEQPPVRSRGRW